MFPQTLPSFHPTCYSGDENSFAYDSTPNFVNDSPNVFNPPPQPPTNSYEFCGNDAHFSYDCPPQVPFIYNPKSCYNQDFNFPQNFQNVQQQYPCCESYGCPHETFQCQQVIFYEPCCENCGDEVIKSSVENLVPIPSKSEDFFDIEGERDVPDCDDSQTINFSTFSNPLFDDSTSSDDKSSHDEVIDEMSFKTYSNPLFDLNEEIISSEFNPIHNEGLDSTSNNDRFDTKSYLLESLLNRDTLRASSPKFYSLLEEFFGELAHTDLILPGINEANCDPKEDIHLVERLLYDNSSPRPPKDFNSENSDVIIESFSPSPIPFEDSNPFMEEIDLFLASDGLIPSGIDSDYSDSEGDNLFLERLFHDNPIPLSDILDFLNVVLVFLPFFTYPVTSSFLLFSQSEDTIFDPDISNYHFSSLEPGVSHRSGTFMKFNVYPNHLNESLMEILSSTCFPRDQ
nr:hypothetical protein [Tanacetum cinerariifolium]